MRRVRRMQGRKEGGGNTAGGGLGSRGTRERGRTLTAVPQIPPSQPSPSARESVCREKGIYAGEGRGRGQQGMKGMLGEETLTRHPAARHHVRHGLSPEYPPPPWLHNQAPCCCQAAGHHVIMARACVRRGKILKECSSQGHSSGPAPHL